ncbi:hypothetical protein H9636_16090 [Ureibacillus sp. Re31]|uniref:Uncharacterized protein n=1 Tax=Ureibacillus galli TaxID=2762222 RepID=A0ABR8XG09_9BACL|nr:hypothetical protein [Ureibacillus galli]MBD8028169.1 hypothetical protein [Ureibacillus galli]
MKEALNKILEIRKRCKKQKTISTHLIVDGLLIAEKALHSANKKYNDLNKRAQKAETEVRRLKARLRDLEE